MVHFRRPPRRLPYRARASHELLVYGLRLAAALWPLWLVILFGPGIVSWWRGIFIPMLPAMLAPFAGIIGVFVLALWPVVLLPFALFFRRKGLGGWVSVDAVTLSLMFSLVMALTPLFSHASRMVSADVLELIRNHDAATLASIAALGVIILLAGIFEGGPRQWLHDLTYRPPAPTPPPPAPPLIRGIVVAPKSKTVRDIDPAALAGQLKSRVIGQDIIADQLSKGAYRRLAQQRRGKPVFTALLAGPTGVGKTEMAKALAGVVFGDEKTMFRIDCGNILGEAGLQTLIGAPTGYMGSDKPGAMTAHVQRFPSCLLLFDEIEKAMGREGQQSPLFRLLLSLLDEGRFTEQSTGQTIDATGCMVVMTSNAAHRALAEIYRAHHADAAALTRATKDELQSTFAPEFLARIDLVTTFSPLDNDARAKVIALQAGRIARQYDVTLVEIEAHLISRALEQWQAMENYGAREVTRWLEEAIADAIIDAQKKQITEVMLTYKDGHVEAVPARN